MNKRFLEVVLQRECIEQIFENAYGCVCVCVYLCVLTFMYVNMKEFIVGGIFVDQMISEK